MTEHIITNPSAGSRIWRIVVCIAIPLAVGGLSAAISGNAMSSFSQMNQPTLSPPAWLFPIAWTILYILMGISSYLIWTARSVTPQSNSEIRNWLIVYGLSLLFNFCWSPVFFNMKWYWFAFIWLLALWVMIFYLVIRAKNISKTAMWLMIPYLLWLTFAGYLNVGIALLN